MHLETLHPAVQRCLLTKQAQRTQITPGSCGDIVPSAAFVYLYFSLRFIKRIEPRAICLPPSLTNILITLPSDGLHHLTIWLPDLTLCGHDGAVVCLSMSTPSVMNISLYSSVDISNRMHVNQDIYICHMFTLYCYTVGSGYGLDMSSTKRILDSQPMRLQNGGTYTIHELCLMVCMKPFENTV